ncbi:MAG: hypothetical protein NTX05_05895 [Fusobacteria bacterium]|nr:hypothetical protein [Fusobacteriota bacterium]
MINIINYDRYNSVLERSVLEEIFKIENTQESEDVFLKHDIKAFL